MKQPKLPAKSRVRKQSKRWLRTKKPHSSSSQQALPGVFSLLKETCRHLWRYRNAYFGIVLVYVLLNIVFVKGLTSSLDVSSVKDELHQNAGLQGLGLNTALLGIVAGSGTGGASDASSLYQSIILLVTALAIIWLVRQTYEEPKDKIRWRSPFYAGMRPLVPFLLVLCVVALELVPMLVGLSVLGTVLGNGLAATMFEQVLWSLLALGLTIWTFYMLSSSSFALLIVTLPDTTPIGALKSASKLVTAKRWLLMRKLFLMSAILIIGFGAILLLCIVLVPVIAEWVLLLLSALLLLFVFATNYRLYRALL